MIKIKKLNSFYIITKLKEHKKIKEKILKLIEKGNFSSFDNINKTDWHLNKETKREYLDYFYKIITPYMNKICKKINADHWKISNGWFQEYKNGNSHDWHRHMEDHFANVYYLHLPDKKNTTKIKDPLTNKEFNIDAKEGDVVTFPAYVLHASEKILSDKTKIIISFNSSFGGYIKC